MARVWIVFREGLKISGMPVAEVPFEPAVSRLDIAGWRKFADQPPLQVSEDMVRRHEGRKRVLVEVLPDDVRRFSAYPVGTFYESPFSPEESLRRIQGL